MSDFQPVQRFTLSTVPPGVNSLYFNAPGRGRVRTREYADWSENARWEIQAQRPKKIEGPVVVEVEVFRTNSRRDIDGVAKPLLDSMTGLVYADDRQVSEVTIRWADVDGVVLRVRPA